ncbi:hypothetical protein [Ralstonia phage RP13]|nr:hypothetical protein [Ralstonia phage RP13]
MTEVIKYFVLSIVFAICLIIVLGLILYILDKVSNILYIRRARADELAVRRYAQSLLSDSWWFSESEEAMHAIQLLAKNLAFTGNINARDISGIRDEWRRLVSRDHNGKSINQEVTSQSTLPPISDRIPEVAG